MSEGVTNELIYQVLTDLRDDNRRLHEKLDHFRSEMNEKMDILREHVGTQQMDIAHIYRRLDFLGDEMERIKSQLPPRPVEH